jgi:large subunit ribosomal protein L22
LVIKEAVIGAAPTQRRFKPRAKGSAGPILRRSSHISITLTGSAPEKRKASRKPAAAKTEAETPAAGEQA